LQRLVGGMRAFLGCSGMCMCSWGDAGAGKGFLLVVFPSCWYFPQASCSFWFWAFLYFLHAGSRGLFHCLMQTPCIYLSRSAHLRKNPHRRSLPLHRLPPTADICSDGDNQLPNLLQNYIKNQATADMYCNPAKA